MTLGEFKAWLDGYLSGKDGLTAEQVAVVQEKLGATFGDLPNITPFQPVAPAPPNFIGPYWSPSIPSTAPRFPWGEVICSAQTTSFDPSIRLNN